MLIADPDKKGHKFRIPHSAFRIWTFHNSQWRGPLLILAAAFLWSTGGLGIKSLPLFPPIIAGWRSVLALPILLIFGASRGASLDRIKKTEIWATSLCYALTMAMFVAATRLTTAANAILLQYGCPLWVILLGHLLFREKPRRRDLLVCAGCFIGLAVFFYGTLTPKGLLGMFLAICSGVTMAGMVIGLRHQGLKGHDSSAGAVVLLGNVLCSLLCLPWMLSGTASLEMRQWFVLAALGTFQIGLPYIFFSAGLKHVTAVRATLLGLLEPLLNPLWVALGNGEIPGAATSAGGGIILVCLIIDTVFQDRSSARTLK